MYYIIFISNKQSIHLEVYIMNGILKKLLLVAGTATITISLLHFTGEENIERIKDKVSSMKSKIVTISNDRNQILNKLQNTINQY